MYETIASPFNYGGVMLKNRIIFAPTTLGLPEEKLLKKYEDIAAGGCAMIVIGDVPVCHIGKEPKLFDCNGAAYYRKLVGIAHAHDCKVSAQLYLSDSFADKISTGGKPRTVSIDELNGYIQTLTTMQLDGYASAFGAAAHRAAEIGFDAVQILGDRMLGSFCSTVFNGRTDRYGGDAENRSRFAVKCVAAVRKSVPHLPIDYKLTVRQEHPHYGNAGVNETELDVFVSKLEENGVSSFHVSLANHSFLGDVIPSSSHPYFREEGCFLKFCDMVREFTSLPICAVGGLTSPDFIEQQLAHGRIQCAAMSRQLIADPAWPNKVIKDGGRNVRRCTRCNTVCISGMLKGDGVYCRYNIEKQE